MSSWEPDAQEEVDAVNSDLVAGAATVDVAIYFPDNLDLAHGEQVNEQLLFEGFRAAKEVFRAADVELRLTEMLRGPLDPSQFMVRSAERGRDLPFGTFANMYVEAERHPSELTDEAIETFRTAIPERPDNHLMVHIVVLQAVFMDYFEPVIENRVYQKQTIETSGLSFPGYMHGDHIPRDLRGVITITNLTRTDHSWKTIAHELGHKLINVSHEHRDVSPAHEILSDEGLMLYGQGTEIASGEEGRFHLERLHRSPFIYLVDESGERKYNPDYSESGFYYDPIYEGVSVDF